MKSRTFVIDKDVLTAEEDQTRTKKKKKEDLTGSENREMEPKKRAPSKYNLCSSYEYTARIYLERTTSN